jgi:hypothetical protein
MTLQVPFADFAETIQRILKLNDAYVSRINQGVLVTSASVENSVSVVAVSKLEPEAVKQELEKQGVVVRDGAWHTEVSTELFTDDGELYVAAVSYKTGDDKPGVWVDAYEFLPTQVQVLRAIYEEFRSTGEVDDLPFEEFVRQANPNVVILGPAELRSFAEAKNAIC